MNIVIIGDLDFTIVVRKLLQNVMREKKPDIFTEDLDKIDGEKVEQLASADLVVVYENDKSNPIMEKIYRNTKRCCVAKTEKPISKRIAPVMPFFLLSIEPINYDFDLSKIIMSENNADSLNNIGIKYGTDKASLQIIENGIRFGHDYLRHYDKLFSRLKNESIYLCEYGCGRGSSLKVWKEYFSEGVIVGVDINERAKAFREERIDIVIGNAAISRTQKALLNQYGSFDIIIDDASHAWGDMRLTLENSWSLLKSGGYYILEDVCCGAYGAYLGNSPVIWDSQHIFDYILDRADIMRMPIDWNPNYNAKYYSTLPEITRIIEDELDEIMIYQGTCVFQKR